MGVLEPDITHLPGLAPPAGYGPSRCPHLGAAPSWEMLQVDLWMSKEYGLMGCLVVDVYGLWMCDGMFDGKIDARCLW